MKRSAFNVSGASFERILVQTDDAREKFLSF
jgi:hypothetical protein